MLLCTNALSLLSTVRSRAQKITLDIFEEEALLSSAKKEALFSVCEEEKLRFALRMAGGSIGKLRRLLDGEQSEYAAYLTAKKLVMAQAEKGRVTYFEFLKTVSDFATTREAFDGLLSYLLTAYTDIARARSLDEAESALFEKEELEYLARIFATGAVMRSFDAANSIKDDTRFNINLSLSAASLGMALWNAVS